MRRNLRHRLGIVEIVAVLEALPFGNLGLVGHDPAGFPDQPANRVPYRGHLADGFGQYVADPFEHLLTRFNASLGIDEFLRRRVQIGEGLVASPDPKRQGLEPFVAGLRGLAALLGFEWKVQILEPLGILGRPNGRRQVGRELALGLDRLEDRLFSLGQLSQSLRREAESRRSSPRSGCRSFPCGIA